MQNLSAMHESNALTDLPHKHDAGLLRQDKIIVDYSLKQLPARNPAQTGQKIQNLFTEEFVLDDSRPCHSQNMIYEIKYWWQILEIFSNRRVTSPIWHLYIYIYSDVQFVTVCFEEIFSNLFSNVKKSAFLRLMLFLFLILLTIL